MSLRILMVTVSDSSGGAARAAYRLHTGLRAIGQDSSMLVADKGTGDPTVMTPRFPFSSLLWGILPRFDTLPKRFYPKRDRKPVFYPGLVGGVTAGRIGRQAPDLVHLHWILRGFMSLEAIGGLGIPVVWTLHDTWAFTGGCTYPMECTRFRESCGCCPQLGSSQEEDLSRRVWRRKSKEWKDASITLACPSNWMAQQVLSSALLGGRKTATIPNGLDLGIFRVQDRIEARRLLGLEPGARIVLFGADQATGDPRKGFHFIVEALRQMGSRSNGRMRLVVFGSGGREAVSDLGIPVIFTGHIREENVLARYYAAADLFVAPSVQDNLPNTVMEAMACGTPCVAFDIGGMPDMIRHQRTGYLARPGDVKDLAAGMAWVLEDSGRARVLGEEGRRRAEALWSLPVVAGKYLDLYREVLDA